MQILLPDSLEKEEEKKILIFCHHMRHVFITCQYITINFFLTPKFVLIEENNGVIFH